MNDELIGALIGFIIFTPLMVGIIYIGCRLFAT